MDLDKAKQAAAQARQKATHVAGGLAGRAAPLVDKAGARAAKGVDATATRLDKATGGRFHDKIENVAHRMEGTLDRRGKSDGDARSG